MYVLVELLPCYPRCCHLIVLWRSSSLTISPKPDQIDKNTLEIAQADDEIYKSLQDLAEELPDHSPRYVLLSYPLTLV